MNSSASSSAASFAKSKDLKGARLSSLRGPRALIQPEFGYIIRPTYGYSNTWNLLERLVKQRRHSGGERAAAMYSILQSAKLNGVNPETYLTDILAKIAAGHPISRISELMPWVYRPIHEAAA